MEQGNGRTVELPVDHGRRNENHLFATMLERLKRLQSGLSSTTDNVGARGEVAAADFLRRDRSFSIVARNWRNPRDRREELDLVARDGEAVVFVEVKTRAGRVRLFRVRRGQRPQESGPAASRPLPICAGCRSRPRPSGSISSR